MTQQTTMVFGDIQILNKGFNEIQALKSALVGTTIPFDADSLENGVVRVDWHGPAVENLISAFNDDFARAVDKIVRHPNVAGMGFYGQFTLISKGFNDTLGITCVTVDSGRVFVEKGEPAWTSPIRRI